MLDSVTVVVQMTGLLLLAPHTPAGGGPLHVVMPATGSDHESWVVFAGDRRDHCLPHIQGLCAVEMRGWSLELGREGAPISRPSSARGFGNVTHASGMPLRKRLLTASPGDPVRSRITLHGGAMTGSCSLGTWQYAPFDAPGRPLKDSLANVVTWVIPKVPRERLLLVRRKLNHQSGDSVQILGTMRPIDGVYGMVVMHEPRRAAAEFANLVRVAFSGQSTPTTLDSDPDAERLPDPFKARHFSAYYDLVRAEGNRRRPLPELVDEHSHKCGLNVLNLQDVTARRGVGTLNCMVALALTEP